MRSPGRPLVVSHRGSECGEAPNTIAAAELGVRLGADAVEVDVQLSRDGVAFLRHHLSLPDGRWAWDADWDGLASDHDPLDAFLDWARGTGAVVMLDLKSRFDDEGALAAETVRLVRDAGLMDRTVLLSWHHDLLLRLKDEHPALRTQALLRGRPLDLGALVRATRCEAVALSYDLARAQDAEVVHEAGAAVVLAELFRPDFERALALGVDAVSWGDPAEARRGLERARLSFPAGCSKFSS